MAENCWDIKGKICLVTGANCGIGRETALQLVKLGAGRVILACRNLETGKEACSYIRQMASITDDAEAERRIVLRQLDLASLESVRKLAATINEEEKELHVLINNAGVLPPGEKTLTTEGFELAFGTNHLGHFLLTSLLLDLIKKSAPARIVVVSSLGYKFCYPWGFHIDDPNYETGFYSAWGAYCQSKLANILFVRELNKRLNADSASGVTAYSLHPGAIKTNLQRHRHWLLQYLAKPIYWFLLNPYDGAKTTIHCATMPGIEKYSGQYFSNSDVADVWAIAQDDTIAAKLWEISEHLVTKT